MITQTITLTKNNGTTYSSSVEALLAIDQCVDGILDEIHNKIVQYRQDSLLEASEVLNDAKTGVIITRQWDDYSWNTYYNFIKDINFNTTFKTNDADGWLLKVTTDTGISYSSE